MRSLRLFKPNYCYHLISRIANRAFYLTDEERGRFIARMWRVAGFSGVEVLAYCLMSNHFHILVYLPEPRELTDDELLDKIRLLYDGERLKKILKEWDAIKDSKSGKPQEAFRKRFTRRMWNVSEFMKTLKQNTSMSYNFRHNHVGTIWEDRFHVRAYASDDSAVASVAGYIDRNPVKAKMVKWPDQYEWCSFAVACKGDLRCQEGYRFIYSFGPLAWEQIREFHEHSIRLTLKELKDKEFAGKAQTGLSVSEKKKENANRRVIDDMTERIAKEGVKPFDIPHLLDRGRDKVAVDLVHLLKDGAKKPSELRLALGIRDHSFFSRRYLTPLEEQGYIKVADKASRYSPKKRLCLTGKGRALVNRTSEIYIPMPNPELPFTAC